MQKNPADSCVDRPCLLGMKKRSQLTLTPFFLLVKGDDNMTKLRFPIFIIA